MRMSVVTLISDLPVVDLVHHEITVGVRVCPLERMTLS